MDKNALIYVAGHRGLVGGICGISPCDGPVTRICLSVRMRSLISAIRLPCARFSRNTARTMSSWRRPRWAAFTPTPRIRRNLSTRICRSRITSLTAHTATERRNCLSGLILHLSQALSSAHQGRISAHRTSGIHQRRLRLGEDCRDQDVPSLQKTVWL